MTQEARTRSENAHNGATTPRHPHDATYWRAQHGTRPAQRERVGERDIDEADACELGSLAALEQIRREREAEGW